jgi:hypothetical protein
VQKERDKDWHERHIKRKSFKEGDLVLVYDSKFLQHPGKFRIHWLGPYEVKDCHKWGSCIVEGFGRYITQRNDHWESIEVV